MKKIYLSSLLLVLAIFVYANYSGTVVTNQNELSFSTIDNYDVVSFTNGFYTEEIGAPQLPVKMLSFLIPADKKVSSIVINNTSIVQLHGTYNIYPVQTPVPTNMSVNSFPFDEPDPLIYGSNSPHPGILFEVYDDGYPMGYHVVTIKFFPVEYLPASGILNLYTNIDFTIVYENNTDNVLFPLRQSQYSNNKSKQHIRRMVENPNDIDIVSGGAKEIIANASNISNTRGMSPTSLINIPDYIIITQNSLISSFQVLADWKTQKGIYALVVDVQDIYDNYQGYDNAEKIRNYLKDVYVNFGSTFILLGGDVEIIPARNTPIYTGIFVTDYYYATVQGNWNANGNNIFGEINDNPDMSNVFFVGRAPVNNISEADNFVNKVIGYEKFDNPNLTNRDYVRNLSFWAGNDGGSETFTKLNAIDATNTGYLAPEDYYVLKLYDPTWWYPALPIISVEGDGSTTTVTCNASHNLETGDRVFMQNWNISQGDVNGKFTITKETDLIFKYTSSGNGTAESGQGFHYKIKKDCSLYPERFDFLSRNNVINSINNGWQSFNQSYGNIHLVYHCDHSGPDGMGTSTKELNESIFRNHVDGLENMTGIKYYPQIIYTDGCSPNRFSYTDAISEHFINNPNGGCVAFLGNSDVGWWSEINYYNYFGNYFCKTLYDLSNPNFYENSNFHIGMVNQASMISIQRKKNRNLLGDPSMMVWTDTPKNLTVSNLHYSATNKQITGTVAGFTYTTYVQKVIVTVCAWKNDEIYATQDIEVTAPTTSLNFTFSNVIANTPGDIIITVSAHNYQPNISTINVPSITGYHPYLISFSVDDDTPNGNNDQQADAGETVNLIVSLKNSGNLTANNVTAELSWSAKDYQTQSGTNATINIITNTCVFGNILPGSTIDNISAPFVFHIHNDAFDIPITPKPLTQFINFTLALYVDGVEFSSTSFEIQIAEPDLVKGENFLTGTLLAGSSNQLDIKLYNKGLSTATGLTATLSTNNPSNISITNDVSPYPDISGVNTTTNNDINIISFEFNIINDNYIDETFNLEVTNSYGKTWVFENFNLIMPIVDELNSDIEHRGYATSIDLDWNVALTTPIQIKGYNLYRSATQQGIYSKINADIINYKTYLDEGLQELTLYYYKLTAIDIHGNESDFFPVDGYPAATSLPFHNGWPITATSQNEMGSRAEGSPNVFDIDGDGKKEIFFCTGTQGTQVGGVWGFKEDGSRWYMLDGNVSNISGIINLECHTSATPALGDVNSDGIVNMGVTTRYVSTSANSLKLFVYEPGNDENPQDNLPDFNFSADAIGWEIKKGCVFSDLNNDGKMEILFSTLVGGIRVITSDGQNYGTWQHHTGYHCGFSMPVAFDFDGDGNKEIILCSWDGVYIFNHDGTDYTSNNPIFTPTNQWRTDFSPIVADINNDGNYEIIFMCAKNLEAHLYAISPDGSFLDGWDPDNIHPSFGLSGNVSHSGSDGEIYDGKNAPAFSVGDINKDGLLEVVCGDNGYLYVWDYTGGNPIVTIPIPGHKSSIRKAPLIADIDNDASDLEIIVTNIYDLPETHTKIFVFKISNNSFENVIGFPLVIQKEILNTPCIDDINNDGKNNLIVISSNQYYVWDTYGDASNNDFGWLSYRRDAQNTGVFHNFCKFNHTALEIDSDYPTITTWDNSLNLNRSLIVKDGQTLIVKSTVTMHPESKIKIEPGAKLVLDGGRITNNCGSFWQGIEVWGTTNASQVTPGAQGIVELKNGAVIENAINGIRNWNPNDWDARGGIIICEDAVFKNNRRAVEFMQYHNMVNGVRFNDLSHFKNTTFVVDDDYIGPDEFYAHVSMWDVQGISFTECHFENNMANPQFNNMLNNNGIHSIDAGYTVTGWCEVVPPQGDPCPEQYYYPSTFSGFRHAIRATSGSTTSQLLNIHRCNFANNNYGVYISGVQNFQCNRNNFTIGNSAGLVSQSDFAIYSTNSTGYQIEENNIISAVSPVRDTWGILIDNSGPDNNQVYRNYFTDINYALVSTRMNRNQLSSKYNGLQFLCNENDNNAQNIHDIYITGKSLSHGISPYQGSHVKSSGNIFSGSPSNTTHGHIRNMVYHFSYYYSGAANSSNPFYPEYISGSLSCQNISSQYANPCLSNIISDGQSLTLLQKQQLNSQFDAAEMNYINVLYNYNQLIDGGNTNALLEEIQGSWSQEAWTMRNELVDISPYLSEEALIEAALTGIMPHAMLLEICLINPEATRSDYVSYILEYEIPNPMPQYMLDMIVANRGAETPRSLIEASLSQTSAQMSFVSNMIISDLLMDSATHLSDIVYWLNRRGSLNDYFLITEHYMNAENFSGASNILNNSIPLQFELTDELNELLDDYIWYNDFRQTVKNDNRTLAQLEQSELDMLLNFAEEKDNKISEYCRNILCFFYETCYPAEMPLDMEPRKLRAQTGHHTNLPKSVFVKVYPNPATTYTTFEWKIPGNSKSVLRISNSTGQIVATTEFTGEHGQWLWDTREIKAGVYVYELLYNNQRLESGRITVVK